MIIFYECGKDPLILHLKQKKSEQTVRIISAAFIVKNICIMESGNIS